MSRADGAIVPDESDVELVRALVPHWHATRRWAEELLCRTLGLAKAEDVLLHEHRGTKLIPGSLWTYRTHGVGVDLDRGLASGGIDFDFDKPEPDAWRLRIFAEKQLNAGHLPPLEYRRLIDDEDRFTRAAHTVLGTGGAG